ncbi:MotA/TolQ/ExbB proton channel family protein [Engelhardtia mirabilis]|uniref:Biopolymer transport protein ExbB n=1 Tax=Engelhardtia mirabilis TaxID=2528011 RepID=A0A518BGK0_9BACT|nr:Biopolymer transport protein ExbB [Planctomycetes bacterium Pla133]QDV00417.1 Biopolymer transport protein ExbB [Planctomycetes bacterium Pla86]
MDEFFQRALGQLGLIWQQAIDIWTQGGLAMIAIAVIALVMFAMGVHVHLRLEETGFQSVPERTWRDWIDHPAQRRGPIGDLLDLVTGGSSIEETAVFFKHMRATETIPFERDLKVMKICVSAAPLVGLLGTVTGMLSTFGALSSGGGGDKTMGMVAAGISEALITTETGLVIALPGLFFQYQLRRRFEGYKAFLAHLETVCTQSVYQRTHRKVKQRARREALARVAQTLRNSLSARAAAGSAAGTGGEAAG